MKKKKPKLLNLILIITSLFGYIQWGKDKSMLLIQGEIDVFSKVIKSPEVFFHPFTLIPLIGQILLVATLFQAKPSKILSFLGAGGIGILMLLILLIGVMNMNFKMIISTIPFLVTVFFAILHHRKKTV